MQCFHHIEISQLICQLDEKIGFNLLIQNVEKWPNILQKSHGVHMVNMYERVKLINELPFPLKSPESRKFFDDLSGSRS